MARNLVAASTQYLANTGGSPVTAYPFCVSARFKPAGAGTNRAVLSLGKTGVTDRHLLYAGTADGVLAFSGSGGTFGQSASAASMSAGTWYQVGGAFANATSRRAVLNGTLATADTTNVAISGMDRVYVGAYYNNGLVAGFYGAGDLCDVGVWDVDLTADEWTALGAGVSPLMVRPQSLVAYWPLLARATDEEDWTNAARTLTNTNAATAADHPRVIMPAWPARQQSRSATTAYTLTAEPGTFTLTGQATGLRAARQLAAAAGTFTLTGNAAGLIRGYPLAAGTGTFVLTGQAAALRADRKLTAATGAFTLTGVAADLIYTPASGAYTLAAGTGVFALTGNVAGLTAARKLTAAAGSFTLTGVAAGLTRSGYRLVAGAGAFALTGNDATLTTTAAASAVIGRRRRTKFPKPEQIAAPAPAEAMPPAANPLRRAPQTTSLLGDANTLIVERAATAQRLHKTAQAKRRAAVERADEAALDRILMDYF